MDAQPSRRRVELPLVLALVLTLAAMLFFDRPLAVGDGLAYLIWLDSIALDGDLDLSNQAEKFAAVNTYHIYLEPRTGRWGSAFPFGVALLLTPFYWLGAALDALPAFRVNDAHFLEIQSMPFAYTLCAMVGVNLYGLLAEGMAYRIARRYAGPWVAAGATLLIFFGTPLLFYTSVDPINSHVAGAFSASLYMLLWLSAREALHAASWRQAGRWLFVGLAAGLTVLCRWQVGLIVVPAGAELRRCWVGRCSSGWCPLHGGRCLATFS